ncbi:hypothetical protein E1A91_A07G021500v1 [Gossypium mustelinum]|uniref:Secreted protein n=1 Tax=Gossypium mustelinum TaxID=34275 RepID=A0A5D2YG82_GOSMU|nr:hypothetical protein E1A91_A07G021500v1 [Gossypium mustelinum]
MFLCFLVFFCWSGVRSTEGRRAFLVKGRQTSRRGASRRGSLTWLESSDARNLKVFGYLKIFKYLGHVGPCNFGLSLFLGL